MAMRAPLAFVVRRVPAIVPFVLLALAAGCGHHRSAMRPVYAVPAPAAATVVPANPCPTGASPATVTPSLPDDGALSSPRFGSPEAVSPPVGPAAPAPNPNEPGLSPATPGVGEGPDLTVPKASRRFDRKSAPTGSGRLSLRSRLEPFVSDPNDLFAPPKADRPWRYVVLHHSAHAAGSYRQIDREHRKNLGTDGCGYHFVIGNGSDSPDGQIEVARRWSDQKAGAHCRNAITPEVNDYGIGICLVGDLDHNPPTPRQIQAARVLVAYLRDRYAIPTAAVGTHAVLAQGPTACPGKHFPAESILGTKSLAGLN
jgi:hypothetical protein